MSATVTIAPPPAVKRCVLLGCESVGKSRLLGSLTGRKPRSEGYRGSTLSCDVYLHDGIHWVDTPGLLRESESETMRAALDAFAEADQVVAVIRATRLEEEWAVLGSLLAGRVGMLVLTFADQVGGAAAMTPQLELLQQTLGVPVMAVDARNLTPAQKSACRDALGKTGVFPSVSVTLPKLWSAPAPAIGWLEKRLAWPLFSLALLFAPAVGAVWQANALADRLHDPLYAIVGPTLAWINGLPVPLAQILGGDYGLVAMLPFLFLYAAPTILVFALLLALYKSTGLIDRIAVALHPWLRPFGLGGRDLVRVVMGFGCNVPAVIATRACHQCSRGACISAISFGSACSYQLPATLAVFAAAGMAWLVFPYLAVLALVICVVAAVLQWVGAIDGLTRVLTPVMALFHLPGDAAPAVVMGSIRKDGLAIALLDQDWGALKVAITTPAQVLTAVYLAGVLLPCIVTLFTVAKEMRWSFALKMAARQAAFAAGFSLIIAWVGFGWSRVWFGG
jgi:ferrous iron transport protein B